MKLDIQLPVHPMPDNATRAVIEIALSMAQHNGHTMDAFGYAEAGPLSPNAHIPAWMSVCTTEGCFALICAYGGHEPSFEGTACSDPCPLTLEEAHSRLVPVRGPLTLRVLDANKSLVPRWTTPRGRASVSNKQRKMRRRR